jgi:hypothetical protein
MDQIFATAARLFADQVNGLSGSPWTGPGLGAWDLRALVGHTSRSLVTVDTYLDRPAEAEVVASPEDYYSTIRTLPLDPADIVERGRQAGLALGEDPAATVRALAERVLARVEAAEDPLIETIAGGMRLRHYLPTRTFELVVHGLDIAHATGQPAPPWPDEVLTQAVTTAAVSAVRQGRGSEVLLALTGRDRLPETFSVV